MDVPRIPGYDVLGRIGAGSTAQVWRARRHADDLSVALKVLPTEPERTTAALREAGVLARVRHQHVIHLYDVVPVPGAGGRPAGVALAMELAEGGSLAQVLGARTHLTPGELVTVCSPLAGALAELHRAGVVHGDIAPGNVLFRTDGMPLLADLGVSRIAGEVRTEVYGTDGMVAPEIVEGFAPSAESDVYGLGALAWRCLVGEPPGWVATRTPLAELRPELPEALIGLVTACLEPEPSDRPEAEELAVALFAAARPEPIELAPGADPAAGLTQRIRAEAAPGAAGGSADGERVDDEGLGGRGGRASSGSGRVRDHGSGRVRDRGAILARAGGRAVHPRALHRESAPASGGGWRDRLAGRSEHRARGGGSRIGGSRGGASPGGPRQGSVLGGRSRWVLGAAALLVGALLVIPAVRSVLPGGGGDSGPPLAPAILDVAGNTLAAGEAASPPDPVLSPDESTAGAEAGHSPDGTSEGDPAGAAASEPADGAAAGHTGADGAVDDAADSAGVGDGAGVSDGADSAGVSDGADSEGAGDAADGAAASPDPAEDPVGAVQPLLDARAAAWRSGNPGDLAVVHVTGSPAYEQEEASLEQARAQDVAYQGLEFTVTRASVLESDGDRVRVEADVRRSDYEALGPAGTRVHPSSTQVVELELRRSEDGWRIWGWG